MFINIPKFKKYIKDTYKSVVGVGIERTESDVLAISAGRLYLETAFAETTKEFRAALVEICGDLPEKGEAITYHEEGDQVAMRQTYYNGLLRHEVEKGTEYRRTQVAIGSNIIYQCSDNSVVMIKDSLDAIFDMSKQESGETPPCQWKAMDGCLFRTNGTQLLKIMPTDPQYKGEEELLHALEGAELNYPTNNEDLI